MWSQRHRWGAVPGGLAPRRAGSRSLRQFSLHTLHLPGAHAGLAAAASSCQLAPASLPPCSCVRLRPLANIVTSGEAQGRMGTPPSSPGPDLLPSNCQATRVPSSCPYLPAVSQCGAAGFSRVHSASAPLSHLLLSLSLKGSTGHTLDPEDDGAVGTPTSNSGGFTPLPKLLPPGGSQTRYSKSSASVSLAVTG